MTGTVAAAADDGPERLPVLDSDASFRAEEELAAEPAYICAVMQLPIERAAVPLDGVTTETPQDVDDATSDSEEHIPVEPEKKVTTTADKNLLADPPEAARTSAASVLVDPALTNHTLGVSIDGDAYALPLTRPRLVRPLRDNQTSTGQRRPGDESETEAADGEELAKSLSTMVLTAVETYSGPDDPGWRAAEVLSETWSPALGASYQLGYARGHAAGQREAEREMQVAWSAAVRTVKPVLAQPTREELDRRRGEHHDACPRRCGSCSACICAAAWRSRGGRPFLGRAAEAELRRNGSGR